MFNPKKFIMKRVIRFQSRPLIGVAASLQDGLDRGAFPFELQPGIAFSIALLQNTVDKVAEEV